MSHGLDVGVARRVRGRVEIETICCYGCSKLSDFLSHVTVWMSHGSDVGVARKVQG